jgi:dTDP-4-dehydrorhamnose reductase
LTDTAPKPVAWITGAAGLIGSHLVRLASHAAPAWHIKPLTRQDLNLLDAAAVTHAFRRDSPQLILHCAALSQSPACQANPKLAWRLNVEVTRQLAELAADRLFAFLSSDLVFDGRRGNYCESDAVNPLSVYAETKVAAEAIVSRAPRHLIIRTSLNGGTSPSGDRGFNEQLRIAFARGQTVSLFTDEFRCPIPAVETARAVWELVSANCHGVYHVAGREKLSRWEIGTLIANRWPDLRPNLRAESLRNYQGAPRSPDTSLDFRKAAQVLSFPLPRLTDWLATHPAEQF